MEYKNENKICQNCKKDFVIEVEDFNFYEKMRVPSPTFCSLCRMKRRFVWRNERMLYKRKSDFTGDEIFTAFSPESNIKIYEKDIWLGDKWDPLDYAMEYDFNRPFFTQFFELMQKVPFKSLNVQNGVGSPYVNNVTDPKNSYLVFNSSNPEDCMYGHAINFCKWCVDVSHVSKCENCYEGFWLTQCSNSSFCSQCENSFNMMFSKNCFSCQDCFGCVNLNKKSYCIFNVQYSREEYLEKIKSFNLGSYESLQKIKKEVFDFWMKFPNKFLQGTQNTNVSGNYIDHSKNVKKSFLVREGQNLKYCQYVQELPGSKDCMDYSVWGDNNQLVYECHSCGIGTQNIKFCVLCQENVHDLEYCLFCLGGSENLFGCVGLRKKSYCILNKQYTKEEYFKMVEKIKKHMDDMPYIDKKCSVYKYGEFFPSDMTPHGYNETLAQEYFPLTKSTALAQDIKWVEPPEREYTFDFKVGALTDDIKDVDDNIVGKVIECEHMGKCDHLCTTAFRIISDELTFYRKMNLPLPRICPNCRTFERLKQRTGIELYKRSCDCGGENSKNAKYKNTTTHSHLGEPCPNEFDTSYSSDRREIVYCEKCYQQEVY
ncbi:MAG: hypothetical protein AAB510_01585 [Patescibacteria group bacterium]